jgi:fumarate reductase flavoprotein subunit
VSL